MLSSTLKRSAGTLAVMAGLLATAGSAGAATPAVVTDNKDPEPRATVTCLDQDLNTLKQRRSA